MCAFETGPNGSWRYLGGSPEDEAAEEDFCVSAGLAPCVNFLCFAGGGVNLTGGRFTGGASLAGGTIAAELALCIGFGSVLAFRTTGAFFACGGVGGEAGTADGGKEGVAAAEALAELGAADIDPTEGAGLGGFLRFAFKLKYSKLPLIIVPF